MKAAGFTDEQAETQAEAIAEIINEQLATKRDLKELEASLKLEINSQKNDLIRWVIGTSAALLGILFALIKLTN